MTRLSRSTLTGLLLLTLVFLSGPARAQTVGGVQVVSQKRVNSSTLEITYRASLTNGAQAIQSATASLIPSPDFQIIDGQLTFGPAGPGAVVPSTDTITLRQSPAAATRQVRLSFDVVVQPVGGGQGGEAVKLRVRPVGNVRSGTPFTIVVDALDANDVPDPNFAGPLTLIGLQAGVAALGQTSFDAPVAAPSFAGGSATFTDVRISNAADGYTFSAQATLGGNLVTDAIDAPFNVTATTFVFSALPHRVSGSPFNLTVTAKDNAGLDAENFTGNIDVSAAATGGSNFVGGTQTAAPVAGSVTFLGLVLNNAANTYNVTASAAGGLSSVSSSFDVVYQALRVLPVANVRAGTPFNLQVEGRDANGNLAENFGTTLANGNDLTLFSLQAAVPALGQTSFNAPVPVPSFGGGMATFTGARISNAADGYTFSAAATRAGSSTVDAIDAGFNVTATTFVFSALPHRVSGSPFNLTVTAKDNAGLDAENFTGNIDVSAAATGGSNFVGGTQTAAPAAGSVTFLGLVLNNAANTYNVTASAAGGLSSVSSSFDVVYQALRVLPVANVRAGTPFNLQVEGRDANGNLAENFGTTLASGNDLTLTSLQAAVPALGQTSFNVPVPVPSFGGGTATFTGAKISNAADGYTFSAAATRAGSSTVDAIDAGFNVTATTFVFSALPHRVSGSPFNLTVTAKDDAGLDAENFTGNIDVSAAATGGSNFVGGTQTVASVAGSATFVGLVLNNAANTYNVTASGAGGLSSVSSAFDMVFSTLTVAAVANVRSGDPFNLQVDARDANGNLAENFGSTLANGNDLSLENLVATVPANGQTAFDVPIPSPSFGGGSATFTGVKVSNAANGYKFNATSTRAAATVDSPDANVFNVTARLLVVTSAVPNHAAGTPFGLTVQARDNNNNVAENFASNVSVDAAAAGGSNFDGGQQTVAAVAGVATFAGLVLSNDADGYLITASAAGLISGVSNAFNVTGNGGGGSEAQSLELSLNQSAIGAGGTTTVFALVRDELDEPIVPSPNVNYSIIADEGASGALPTVLNGVIQTSANTRGGFILHGQVDGTAVTDDVFFAVLQNAGQSANAGKFVTLAAAEGTIAAKLAELAAAMEANNLAAIPAIKTALQNAINTVPTTGRNAIQRARVVAPETGFLPTSAQLTAAGFPVTAADNTFGTVIANIVAKLNQVKAFYDALPTNPASGGTDSVAQLNQLNVDLAALQAQLEGLDITPQAIVLHTAAINNLIRLTMPLQMKSVVTKVNAILTANALAGLQATPEEFFDGTVAPDTALALASPDAFYGNEQPAFFGLVGMFGGCSLQMNLVNRIYGPVMAQVSRMMVILAANALLEEYLNPASLVALITGASQSIHIYNAAGSVIEGYGINQSVASNEVFLIGGGAVAAVEGLIDAFNPSNIDSFDDIDDYFEGIVDAIEGAGEAYDTAEQPPDGVSFGCVFDDGSGCMELVFNNGFDNVASCSGFFCFDFTVIVLYHNKDTGHWASQLVSFDP